MLNDTFFCFVISLPMGIIVYNFLPVIYVHLFCRDLNYLQRYDGRKIIGKILTSLPFGEKLRMKILFKIEESGIGDGYTWIYWGLLTVLLPVLTMIIMLVSGKGLTVSAVFAVCCFIIPEMWLKHRIDARRKAFLVNSYKIYSFLHTQISAGIKPTDAIRGIYEIADHPLIQNTFIRFTAQYELTLDIEAALQIIRRSYRGHDGEMLCVCIKQCIDTGMAGKTLMKMEEMMFSKYFNIIQNETERYRTRLLLAGLTGLIPMIILLCMPMIYEAMTGFMSMLAE